MPGPADRFGPIWCGKVTRNLSRSTKRVKTAVAVTTGLCQAAVWVLRSFGSPPSVPSTDPSQVLWQHQRVPALKGTFSRLGSPQSSTCVYIMFVLFFVKIQS